VDRNYAKALLAGALFALPVAVMFAAVSFWPNAQLHQPNDFYLGSDFVNYWTGGRLALEGRLDILYDLTRYNELLNSWFFPEMGLMSFSYPPHALFFFVLPGALPYLAALTLWSVFGAIAFIAVALGRWPERGEARLVWALVLAPVLWGNVVFGQLGLFLALAFVGALRALPARPALAGVLIGFLTVKPQLGLLLPFVLIALGQRRAFAAAVVTTVALIGASIAVFGVEPWQVYLAETMPFQWQFIERMNGFYRFQMVTPFTAAWFIGLPIDTALAVQFAASIGVLAAVLVVVRSEADWPLKSLIVALGATLMVPYVLSYDLAIPLAALIWWLRDGGLRASPLSVAFVTALWALPFAVGILIQIDGAPVLPLVLMASFAWLVAEALGYRWSWRRQRQAPAPVVA